MNFPSSYLDDFDKTMTQEEIAHLRHEAQLADPVAYKALVNSHLAGEEFAAALIAIVESA